MAALINSCFEFDIDMELKDFAKVFVLTVKTQNKRTRN